MNYGGIGFCIFGILVIFGIAGYMGWQEGKESK